MNSALIVAAGQGTRMATRGDKLFLELGDRPLIAHTWARFDQAALIDEIVLVVRKGKEEDFRALAQRYCFQRPYRLVCGGAERQDSVWNGLEALSRESEIVAIHDGARPCVAQQLIQATLEGAREVGAAVAAQKLTDTIKESGDGRIIQRTIDRSRLWSVQTPQAFRVEVIRKALAAVRQIGQVLTDDTAACERIGQPVLLVESQSPNPKATSVADLPYLEWLLLAQNLR